LFRVRDFSDLRVSSENNIVAIYDVITAVLLNIFVPIDTLLEGTGILCKVQQCRYKDSIMSPKTRLSTPADYKIQELGNEQIPSTSFNHTVRLTKHTKQLAIRLFCTSCGRKIFCCQNLY